MALSKGNPADIHQLENSISQPNEQASEKVPELEGLLALLYELQIVDRRKKQKLEADLPPEDYLSSDEIPSEESLHQDENLNSSVSDFGEPTDNLPQNSVVPPAETEDNTSNLLALLSNLAQLQSNAIAAEEPNLGSSEQSVTYQQEKKELESEIAWLSAPIAETTNNTFTPTTFPELSEYIPNPELETTQPVQPSQIEEKPPKSSKKSTRSDAQAENTEELFEIYKRLQSALVGPELEAFQDIINHFDRKVTKIEYQIYEPTELINLLLPVISDILNRKIAESIESKESIVEAFVPIIHEVIQLKNQSDREAMGSAIAAALPIAVTEGIRNNPEELAMAIAPDMAIAIKEQIRLAPQAMVDALYPIIHTIIESKREEDIDAISAAIAPLLPPAISAQIQNSPREIAQAIAPEMAAAIREQIRLDRDAMIETLAPEMGKTIKAQIEIERDAMVDALYPVIGNTIAKYMADVIRNINEKIESTLSLEGINRKMRAKMQGVSEAELIIKEAVPFKVRAAFLIHKQSGLVISEAQATGNERLEADMVAGMLTAIRTFVNDCIAQSGDVSEIDAIDYGNSKIMLEVAGYCYLVAVTQGEFPHWFVYRLQQTLYSIVEISGNLIENYEGDPSVFPDKVNQILESLINIQTTKKKKFAPTGLLILSSLVAGLILVPWGYFQYRHAIDLRIQEESALALASAPELAVYRLDVGVRDGKVQLSGRLPNQYLRNRAEQIVKKVAPKQPLENKIIPVEVPPDPVLVAAEVKRVTSILNQSNGVAISSRYTEGKVTVEGTVTQVGDTKKITQAFQQIPGIKTISNTVQLQQLSLPIRIYFHAGSSELKAENKNQILQVKQFLNRYPEINLTIIGHSDTTGNSSKNEQLALSRAETVRVALVTQGINPKRLQAVATPNPPLGIDSRQPLWLSRCVQFQPMLTGFKRK